MTIQGHRCGEPRRVSEESIMFLHSANDKNSIRSDFWTAIDILGKRTLDRAKRADYCIPDLIHADLLGDFHGLEARARGDFAATAYRTLRSYEYACPSNPCRL